jgi:hypothetical protein
MKKLMTVAVAVACLSTMAMADGLEVGSRVAAFYVTDVTGPAAGEKLCYRCKFGDRPTVTGVGIRWPGPRRRATPSFEPG